MTTVTLKPIDDPQVRAHIAKMYVDKARDEVKWGYKPASTVEMRLLHIAANWERVRDQLARLVAMTVVDRETGQITGRDYGGFGADFAAAQIMAERSMARWRKAYLASKEAG